MSPAGRQTTRLDLGGHVFYLRWNPVRIAVWEREIGKTLQHVVIKDEWGFYEVIKAVTTAIAHHWEGNSTLPTLTDDLISEWIMGYAPGWANLVILVKKSIMDSVPTDQTKKAQDLPAAGVQPPFVEGTPTKETETASTGSGAPEKPPAAESAPENSGEPSTT